jgi:DNA-binding transcriptional MerR regulator
MADKAKMLMTGAVAWLLGLSPERVRELPIPHQRSENGVRLYDLLDIEQYHRLREARRNAAVQL